MDCITFCKSSLERAAGGSTTNAGGLTLASRAVHQFLPESRVKLDVLPVAAGLVIWMGSASALAQNEPPPPNYSVDAAQGPLTGSTRVIGLGGAFVAIAEGRDGVAVNPASVAVRSAYSWNRWDYGFGLDFAIGSWLPETDFLNQGETAEGEARESADVERRSLLFGSVGVTLQYDLAGLRMFNGIMQQLLNDSIYIDLGLFIDLFADIQGLKSDTDLIAHQGFAQVPQCSLQTKFNEVHRHHIVCNTAHFLYGAVKKVHAPFKCQRIFWRHDKITFHSM